jgi:NitT/TauT family transport system ATP-binding protein
MLEIKELTHSYGDQTVLGGLSLKVAQGELVSIVGPSGCGKSTLLRCVAGLIRPTSGQVVLDGEPVDGVPDGLAVVFQDYSRSLFPWLTVRDNVALPLRRRGMAKAERRLAAQEALESVGLGDAGRKYPWQLSGGMQQRVSIARALAYRPSFMLMDEPFGSVDAQTREDLEDLVLRVHRDTGMTILLVTHDIDESVYVGDRVVVLARNPGRVRAELPVGLPTTRDQIETRGLPEFVRLRAEVGRLVRGSATGEPAEAKPTETEATETKAAEAKDAEAKAAEAKDAADAAGNEKKTVKK